MSDGLNLHKEKGNIDCYLLFPMTKDEYWEILQKLLLRSNKKDKPHIKLALYNTKDEADKNDKKYLAEINEWTQNFQKENPNVHLKMNINERIYIKRTMRKISFLF